MSAHSAAPVPVPLRNFRLGPHLPQGFMAGCCGVGWGCFGGKRNRLEGLGKNLGGPDSPIGNIKVHVSGEEGAGLPRCSPAHLPPPHLLGFW